MRVLGKMAGTSRPHVQASEAQTGPCVRFAGNIDNFAEVQKAVGTSSSGAIIRRMTGMLVSGVQPLWISIDADELAFDGRTVPLASVITTTIEERSERGYFTHLRTNTRSIMGSMPSIIHAASIRARLILCLDLDQVIPDGFAEQFDSLRIEFVEQSIADNRTTEGLLVAWSDGFGHDWLGDIGFRASASHPGSDYIVLGFGKRAEFLDDLTIVRNERCRGVRPFEGIGQVVDPWTRHGEETERKLTERWEDAVKNPPTIHFDGFAERCIRIWDESHARQAAEADGGVERSIIDSINGVYF